MKSLKVIIISLFLIYNMFATTTTKHINSTFGCYVRAFVQAEDQAIVIDPIPEKYKQYSGWYNKLDTVKDFGRFLHYHLDPAYDLTIISRNAKAGDKDANDFVLNVYEYFLQKYNYHTEAFHLGFATDHLINIPPSPRAFNILSAFALDTRMTFDEDNPPDDVGNSVATGKIFSNLGSYFPIQDIRRYRDLYWGSELDLGPQEAQRITTEKMIDDYEKGLVTLVSYEEWKALKERNKR